MCLGDGGPETTARMRGWLVAAAPGGGSVLDRGWMRRPTTTFPGRACRSMVSAPAPRRGRWSVTAGCCEKPDIELITGTDALDHACTRTNVSKSCIICLMHDLSIAELIDEFL